MEHIRHNPGPISEEEQLRIHRYLAAQERKEARELAKEEEREAKREAKRLRRSIRRCWDKVDNRMREDNARARDERASALRAAEWTAPAPPRAK